MKRALLALAFTLAAPLFAAPFKPVIAIRNAHVITGAGADFARGTVVLRDGLMT